MTTPTTQLYDLFVSYANADREWVEGYLLNALNHAGVCYYSEVDFPLGVPRVIGFDAAVQQSLRTLLIISPDYIASSYHQFADLLAQTDGIETGKWSVIPLLLHPVTLPRRLALLNALDATDPAKWSDVVDRLCAHLNTPPPVAPPPPACPYPGMVPFQAKDAEHFYGRDDMVTQLLQLLRQQHFLFINGPSGSGKSSLIRAGLLPQLARSTLFPSGFWVTGVVRPGDRPMDELTHVLGGDTGARRARAALDQANQGNAAALERIITAKLAPKSAQCLLLIVDQFEELFTQASREDQRGFVAAIRALRTTKRCIVLIAMSSNYYPELQTSDLWPIDRSQQIDVVPLQGAALRAAIIKPAESVGVYLEPRLVDRLIADSAEEPGALPLLQETMQLLWARMERLLVPLHAYQQLGSDGRSGLALAIARKADAALADLPPTQLVIIRRMFLRLVQFVEGREPTRRRQPIAALQDGNSDPRDFQAVLEHLVANRLLTLSGKADSADRLVDLAHEALITGWPTLQSWLAKWRADEQIRRQLEDQADKWRRRGAGQGGLLDAEELAEVEQWLASLEAIELGISAALLELVEASQSEHIAAQERKKNEEQRFEEEHQRRLQAEEELKRNQEQQLAAANEVQRAQAEAERLADELRAAEARQQEAEDRLRQAEGGRTSGRLLPLSPADRQAAEAQRTQAEADLKDAQAQRQAAEAQRAQAEAALKHAQEQQQRAEAETKRTQEQIIKLAQQFQPRVGRNSILLTFVIFMVLLGAYLAFNQIMDADGRAAQAQAAQAQASQGRATANAVADELATSEAQASQGRATAVAQTSQQRATAVAQVNDATSRKLAAQAQAHLLDQTDLALLLGLQALNIADTADGRSVLLKGLEAQPRISGQLRGHTSDVTSVSFSPDGKTIVSGSADNSLTLWDVATQEPIGPLLGHTAPIRSVAFSPNGAILASGGDDTTIILWNTVTRAPLDAPLSGHTGSVRSVVFSPNGQILVSSGDDGVIIIWDVRTRQIITYPWISAAAPVQSMAFSPDGRILAAGRADGTIFLWDMRNQQALAPMFSSHGAVTSLAFDSNGDIMASGHPDGTILLWEVATWSPKAISLQGHAAVVNSMAFSPDGATLASGTTDDVIILWNTKTHRPLSKLDGGSLGGVASVVFSPDGATLASGNLDSTVTLWNLTTHSPLIQPIDVGDVTLGDLASIESVAYSPDGKLLVFGSADSTIKFWDPSAYPSQPLTLQKHTAQVNSVAFSPNGKRLASGSADKTIILWDVATQQPLATLTGHTSYVNGVAFSPDGTLLASASADNTIKLWNVDTHQLLATLSGHTKQVNSVAFSPDGKLLASGSNDNTIMLWDVGARRPLGTLTGHTSYVNSVAFSPDGKLASGSDDKTIMLWDVQKHEPIGPALLGHRAFVNSVAFSPKSSTSAPTLVSGSVDGALILWDVTERRQLGIALVGHKSYVNSVTFSPDGQSVASGSANGALLSWGVDPQIWKKEACRVVHRNLSQAEWNEFIGNIPYRRTCSAYASGVGAPLDAAALAP